MNGAEVAYFSMEIALDSGMPFPSLSVLDGWWLEGGCVEGVTGWAIGERRAEHPIPEDGSEEAANALYRTLDEVVAPCFYQGRKHLLEIMRHAIALNGAYFNAQRMLGQYVVKAYYP